MSLSERASMPTPQAIALADVRDHIHDMRQGLGALVSDLADREARGEKLSPAVVRLWVEGIQGRMNDVLDLMPA